MLSSGSLHVVYTQYYLLNMLMQVNGSRKGWINLGLKKIIGSIDFEGISIKLTVKGLWELIQRIKLPVKT